MTVPTLECGTLGEILRRKRPKFPFMISEVHRGRLLKFYAVSMENVEDFIRAAWNPEPSAEEGCAGRA